MEPTERAAVEEEEEGTGSIGTDWSTSGPAEAPAASAAAVVAAAGGDRDPPSTAAAAEEEVSCSGGAAGTHPWLFSDGNGLCWENLILM